jgi:thioredoxin 1
MMTADTATNSDGDSPAHPIAVDDESELDDIVASHHVVLVDFYADWCGPCKMLEPIVERLAEETGATVAKVDVDVNQQLATTYDVRGVPTLVLFADGAQVDEVVGVQPEGQLRSLVESYT